MRRRIQVAIPVLLAFFPTVLSAAQSLCALQTSEGEKLIDAGRWSDAQKKLESAAKICDAAPTEKSARPYVALGKAYYELQRYPDAVTQFEKALTKQPGLASAYRNLGAAYVQMDQYEKAIENLDKADGKGANSTEEFQIQWNLGLAYFKWAAQKADEKDARSKPFFEKAQKLNDSYGGTYYYLGVLAEVGPKDRAAAEKLYKAGCERKYQQACTFLSTIGERMAATRPVSSVPAAGNKVSAANEKLLGQLQTVYEAKGFDATNAATVIGNLRNACANLSEAQCKSMVDSTLSAMK